MENFNSGALLDPRSKKAKAKDWQHDIVASDTPVIWQEKSIYKFYDKRNQASSLSCMAQSGVKMLGIELPEFKTLSAKPVYQSRTNKGGGMYQQECLAGLCKPITPLENVLPSQGMGESDINLPFSIPSNTTLYNALAYVPDVPIDIDKIAGIIQQGKGVQLMMFFLPSEWWRNKPEIQDNTLKYYEDRASRHGVIAGEFTLLNGEKCLIIEDSAGNSSSINGNGQRIITETFLKTRCFAAGYLIPKPKSPFVRTLRMGMRGDDVKELQKRLGVIQTGYFYTLTLRALKKFQQTNGLVPDGIAGKLTFSKLL